MKAMKKIFIVLMIMGGILSCDDRFEEMNRPKKNPTEVTGEPLFANGVRNMFDMMASTDVNSNIFRLLSQYWAQTTYPDESQYNIVGREIADNFWEIAYRDVLKDLDEAGRVIRANYDPNVDDEATINNQLAMISICKIYTYSVLVDAFGAIPYQQAINDDALVPEYDPGDEVYSHLIDSLDAAIETLDPNAEGFSSTQDLIYEGDVAGWLKFANSLKLRLAITIADVEPQTASTMVSEAVAGGLFLSNADNATIQYQGAPPSTNPLWEDLVQSGRADYVISNTVVDRMQDLFDPRLPVYGAGMDFEYPINPSTRKKRDSVFTTGGNMVLYYPAHDSIVYKTTPFTIYAKDSSEQLQLFIGGEFGTSNTYSANSHVGDLFHEPDLEGIAMDYAEVQFLLAEAAARGFDTPGSAADHYEEGIRASMEYWGVDPDNIEDYLDQPSVAYNSAPGTWREKIGIQSWLAFYNRGFEGWTVWRRLDFSGFNVPDGLTAEDIPNRLTFPIEEATLNPTSFKSAVELIGGSDDVQTKVFWDVH